MKIAEILRVEMVVSSLQARTKDEVISELVAHLSSHGAALSAPVSMITKALMDRERLGSTGVGEGVAIPHAKIHGLTSLVAAFGRSQQGIPFDAIDQLPVKLICVLLVPENSAGVHLKALARISRLLKHSQFRERLLEVEGDRALYEAFVEEDAKF